MKKNDAKIVEDPALSGKIVFKKEAIELLTDVSFPILGLKEVKTTIPYNKFPNNVPLNVSSVKPIFNNGVLVAIEMEIKGGLKAQKIVKKRHAASFADDLRFVARVASCRGTKEYDLFQSKSGMYYLKDISSRRHYLRRTLSEEYFQKMIKWFKQQLLPQKYRELERLAYLGDLCGRANFWDFIMIAKAKGLLKTNYSGQNTTIIHLGQGEKQNRRG